MSCEFRLAVYQSYDGNSTKQNNKLNKQQQRTGLAVSCGIIIDKAQLCSSNPLYFC